MADFSSARKAMVDSQIHTSSVTDRRLLAAMGQVPREIFVPANRRELAYLDDHQPLGGCRFLAAPATFARLVQLAEISENDSVLDVGSGTGYSLAVMAALARQVCGLESDAGLARAARDNLARLGIDNAIVMEVGPEMLGPQMFDVILVEGAVDAVPEVLVKRLAPGGRLVALVRQGMVGTAMVRTRTDSGITGRSHFNATLPPQVSEPVPEAFVF